MNLKLTVIAYFREIDGKIFPGEVNEKAKAKEKYDKAKKKGQSAGHVAQKYVFYVRHRPIF